MRMSYKKIYYNDVQLELNCDFELIAIMAVLVNIWLVHIYDYQSGHYLMLWWSSKLHDLNFQYVCI